MVVEARTGIAHQQQYGGTACRRGQVEGFPVPLFDRTGPDALRELFEQPFRGAGTWNRAWSEDERGGLRESVGAVRYWACDGTSEEPHRLWPDECRIREVDEAWVPVITPDGPGVLVWSNSDRPAPPPRGLGRGRTRAR
ncbi:DUF6210 family protein [Streptomyces sp. NRRL B-24484]|uniref:DUF6210 family protein n=1 Tax=Streptomyces sp. NRRL B-24484 TaxID=1463833 RepID=UPI000693E8B2|nr:DUF6210 family protein [Streptomyces sp. NRRL B-24484]